MKTVLIILVGVIAVGALYEIKRIHRVRQQRREAARDEQMRQANRQLMPKPSASPTTRLSGASVHQDHTLVSAAMLSSHGSCSSSCSSDSSTSSSSCD